MSHLRKRAWHVGLWARVAIIKTEYNRRNYQANERFVAPSWWVISVPTHRPPSGSPFISTDPRKLRTRSRKKKRKKTNGETIFSIDRHETYHEAHVHARVSRVFVRTKSSRGKVGDISRKIRLVEVTRIEYLEMKVSSFQEIPYLIFCVMTFDFYYYHYKDI